MSEAVHTGGCQCGAVRYKATAKIGYPHICHCRMCQKAGGNYFMPLGSVRHRDFSLTRGAPTWFSSSDLVRRGFCASCGTPLFYEVPGETSINIVLGSLDDPDRVEPVAQSNEKTKMSWFQRLDTLPSEPTLPADEARAGRIVAANHQHPDHDTITWPLEKTS